MPKIVNNMKKIVAFPGARHGHLSDAVRGRIEQMVLRGDIEAGTRVNELRLASALKVSRGPVREALRGLERAGLLVAIPNRGWFVRKLALEEALHLYDVRAGLARSAARLAAQRASERQLKRLQDLFQRMEQAAATRDAAHFNHWNSAFHAELMEASGNARLIALNESVRNELQLYLGKGVVGPAQLRASQAEHRAVLSAIERGDAEAASAAFESHVLAGKQRMLDYLGGHSAKKVS
jgi:DNA-binding GntR family transcriptional regulator